MIREINRKTWSSFCRKFNSKNRYRTAQLAHRSKNSSDSESWQTDVLGISLSKRGRTIDGVRVFALPQSPQSLDQPQLELPKLERLTVETDGSGQDEKYIFASTDGSTAEITFTDESQPNGPDHLVEKIAYAFSEQRGFAPGQEEDDWFEAERAIEQICSDLPR